MRAADVLTDQEIAAILERPKFMDGNLEWNERPTNSRFLASTANIMDENGATIAGLTAELNHRRGRVIEDCKYDFTVFLLRGTRKYRVYQINVLAKNKSSHSGTDGVWYGPHQHFGERAARFAPDPELCCEDDEQWLLLFLKNANVQFNGKYSPPVQQLDLPNI